MTISNIVRVLYEMSPEKRAMHSVHVVTIVSKDPGSYLPDEMKEYYGVRGITFSEFPLHPIGRAKNLMDEMPDTEEFYKQLAPEKTPGKMPIATLIGECFYKNGKKLVNLGKLKDILK